jgi:hypothetical protein
MRLRDSLRLVSVLPSSVERLPFGSASCDDTSNAMVRDADVELACSRCHEEPRLPGQRWCRRCLTTAQRARRGARRAAKASETSDATLGAAEASIDLVASGEQSVVTHPSEASLRPDAGGDLASDALERYRQAVAEFERVSHETDWRRSKWAPPIILRPIMRAITHAEAECRQLGVAQDALRRP